MAPQQPPPEQQCPPPPAGMPQGAQAPPPESAGTEAANTESFFISWVEPHFGQGVPFQSADRTRSSLAFPHALHSNS